MKKKILFGSIIAGILLVTVPFSNAVGYHTSSEFYQQNTIEDDDKKELLFDVFLEIVNDKEIRRIITDDQSMNYNEKSSFLINHQITRRELSLAYSFGLLFYKNLPESDISRVKDKFYVKDDEIKHEILGVIENDNTLLEKLSFLSCPQCDCNEVESTSHYPLVICVISLIVFIGFAVISLIAESLNLNILFGLTTIIAFLAVVILEGFCVPSGPWM